jgi:hypothetical protein
LVAKSLEISYHNNKPKYYDIIVIDRPDYYIPYSITIFKKGLLENKLADLKKRFKVFLSGNKQDEKISIKIYQSNYLQLQHYTSNNKYTLDKLYSSYRIKKEEVKQAVLHGKLLYVIKDNLDEKIKPVQKPETIPPIRTYERKPEPKKNISFPIINKVNVNFDRNIFDTEEYKNLDDFGQEFILSLVKEIVFLINC